MTYAAAAQRFRVPLGFVLAALYLAFVRPTAPTLVFGGSVAFGGVLVRAWAAGHIVKNDALATSGPYAHTRNPLYLGSFLIAAGFAFVAHWSLLLLVSAFFAAVYVPVMEREHTHISNRFPEAYAEYARNVPPFVPRPRPWRTGATNAGGFSMQLYLRHREWRALVAYVGVMLFLAYRMRAGP